MQFHEENRPDNKQQSPLSKPAFQADKSALKRWLSASERELVVIVFTAEWMGSTFMFQDSLKKISADHPRVKFFEVDVERDSGYAKEFNVTKIPTVILLRKREVVDVISGTISQFKLIQRMMPYLPGDQSVGSKQEDN